MCWLRACSGRPGSGGHRLAARRGRGVCRSSATTARPPELAGIDDQQFGACGQMSAEQISMQAKGPAGCRDRQLLPGDLEQHRAVQVHRRRGRRRPGPGTRARPRRARRRALVVPAAPRAGPPLTDSEMRVLRYLPTNLTRPDIAGELCVSLNTVSTHMRNLYAKLGVHSRREAVDRARALGLLALSARRA